MDTVLIAARAPATNKPLNEPPNKLKQTFERTSEPTSQQIFKQAPKPWNWMLKSAANK